MARFKATKEGMMCGYWRVVDTYTGQTVRSGFVSASVAKEVAAKLNRENGDV